MSQDISVYLKSGTGPTARTRLRVEAERLRQAAGPGVVPLVALRETEEHTELVLDEVAAHTLATLPAPSAPDAVSISASLAQAVADLHQVGLAHHRLTADHVLVTPDQRAILCGFAEVAPGSPAEDVRSLGTLVELLAASVTDDHGRSGRLVRELLTLADQIRDADHPPKAAEVARRTGELLTTARPTRWAPVGRSPLGPRARRGVIVASGALAVAIAMGVLVLGGPDGSLPDDPIGAPTPDTGADPPGAAPSTTSGAADTSTTVAAAPGRGDRRGDTDTPAAAGPTPAPTVVVDATAYAAGRPGDRLVAGDWNCDGSPQGALLRPTDGTIWLFDKLAGPGEVVEARALAPVPDAVDLQAIEQPDGCTSLVAELSDGSPFVVLDAAE